MKKVKVVFQGDSITDAGRDKRNYHDVGPGYPKYASEGMIENHKDVEFEFINFGISGNRTCQLFDRLYADALAFDPDVISILIGINDIWHRYGSAKVATTDAQLELNYRSILERIRSESHAKIVILAPFLLDADIKPEMREDLERILPVIRKLADESKQATAKITSLIQDIRQTANSTVMATEEGTKEIESGVKLAHHIDRNINSLIEVINQISATQGNIIDTVNDQIKYADSSEEVLNSLIESIKSAITKTDNNIESMYLLSSLSDSVKSKITD